MSTCEQRVDRGFDAVTEDLGPEWTEKINMAMLDMDDVLQCVLGQAYGRYWNGLEALDLSYQDAQDYGFITVTENSATLRSAWVKKIRAAQKALES